MPVTIIHLHADDKRMCAAVGAALHREFYASVKKTLLETALMVEKTCAKPTSLILVAVDGGEMLGTLSLHLGSTPGEVVAGDLYVKRDSRNNGVGTLLAGHGIRNAMSVFSAKHISAQVHDDAPQWLISFYESLGFLCAGGKRYILYL